MLLGSKTCKACVVGKTLQVDHRGKKILDKYKTKNTTQYKVVLNSFVFILKLAITR